MKKTFTILTFCLLAANLMLAKNPRLKKQSFSYETTKLPVQKLPSLRSYALQFEAAAPYGPIATQSAERIQVPGWTEDFNNGEYLVQVFFDKLWFEAPTILVREDVICDTADQPIDTIYFYRNHYTARAAGQIRVLDASNRVVYSRVLNEVCKSADGREFRNRKATRIRGQREAQQIHLDMMQGFATQLVRNVNRQLDYQFGIYAVRKAEHLLVVKNRSHKEYRRMNELFRAFNMISDRVHANIDLNVVAADLVPHIEYLKGVANKYQGNKKADRQMRHIAFYNLATIHMMLEQPAEALYYAQQIRNNDYKRLLAKSMVRTAQDMQRLHQIHGM